MESRKNFETEKFSRFLKLFTVFKTLYRNNKKYQRSQSISNRYWITYFDANQHPKFIRNDGEIFLQGIQIG